MSNPNPPSTTENPPIREETKEETNEETEEETKGQAKEEAKQEVKEVEQSQPTKHGDSISHSTGNEVLKRAPEDGESEEALKKCPRVEQFNAGLDKAGEKADANASSAASNPFTFRAGADSTPKNVLTPTVPPLPFTDRIKHYEIPQASGPPEVGTLYLFDDKRESASQ